MFIAMKLLPTLGAPSGPKCNPIDPTTIALRWNASI